MAEAKPHGYQDADLVRALKTDPGAMETLYRRHADGLYRYALALTGDAEAARDAVQETMLAAWRGSGEFAGRSKVSTWLVGICRNKVLDCLGKRGRAQARQSPAAGISDATRSGGREPGGHPDEARERLEFWDVFGRLPYEQREVLLLVFEYGFSQDEAAEALGIPKGTVRSRLYRARKNLHALLSPEAGTGGSQVARPEAGGRR